LPVDYSSSREKGGSCGDGMPSLSTFRRRTPLSRVEQALRRLTKLCREFKSCNFVELRDRKQMAGLGVNPEECSRTRPVLISETPKRGRGRDHGEVSLASEVVLTDFQPAVALVLLCKSVSLMRQVTWLAF